jgi:murein DD-endopeptidase MepM/ murein hydrolase activator NlpD
LKKAQPQIAVLGAGFISAIALSLCLSARPAIAGDPPWAVSLSSPQVFQGGVVKIDVSGSDVSGVKGSLSKKELLFFPNEHGSYSALLGVDLEEKSSAIEIIISALNRAGRRSEKPVTLRVREKAFPKEELTVPDSFDRIDEAARKRIEREQARLSRLWTASSGRRLWEGGFLAPVAGEVTSPFGLRRVVNGLARAPHGGVDLKAPLGTQIAAANHGRVVLRDEFFFSGKSIVLDHGAGLYTMYFHLADFRVEEGLPVRKGDLIGLAGMSGRVTGPHLHWGARLNGARVDPFQLLETIGSRQ